MRIASYLPSLSVDNFELENSKLTAKKIFAKTGITSRKVVSGKLTAIDLAFEASSKLVGLKDFDDVDALLYCTQSPDYIVPNNVSILHSRLEIRKNIPTIEYNQGCSGYIYGLYLARTLLLGDDLRKVLLVTADTYTKYLKSDNLSCRTIFGDAATATLISSEDVKYFGEFSFGTNGDYHKALYLDGEGSRTRGNQLDLKMNGPEIFCFTLEVVPEIIRENLEKNRLKLEDIDHFIFHQANGYMLEALRKKVGIPKEKFHLHFEESGNTVSSTIPIVLEKLYIEKTFKKGEKVMLCAFGVGLSWNATVFTVR